MPLKSLRQSVNQQIKRFKIFSEQLGILHDICYIFKVMINYENHFSLILFYYLVW